MDAHPAFDPERLAEAKKAFHMAKNVCKLAALALPEWKRVPDPGNLQYREEVLIAKSSRKHRKDQKRHEEASQQERLTADGGHVWLHYGGKG